MSVVARAAGRKRSSGVRLSKMVSTAGAFAGSALLAGCGSEAPAPVDPDAAKPKSEVMAFENVFECKANSDLTQDQCADARKQAVATSDEIGPRFAGLGDCENEWGGGGCAEHTVGGAHFFAPFVTGFLVGKLINGRRDYLPLYRKAGENGGYVTANGARLGYGGAPGKYLAVARALEHPRAAPAIKANTGAVARGGMVANDDDDDGYSRGTRVRRFGG